MDSPGGGGRHHPDPPAPWRLAARAAGNRRRRPKDGEPVVVRISMDNKLMTEAAQQFEKDNPDIKIQFESPSDDEQKLMSALRRARPHDILRILGAQQLSGYVVKGIALNLDDYFSKSSLIRADDMRTSATPTASTAKTSAKAPSTGFPRTGATTWPCSSTNRCSRKPASRCQHQPSP